MPTADTIERPNDTRPTDDTPPAPETGPAAPDDTTPPAPAPNEIKALWKQAGAIISLVAAFSYGLGRLMVDGFYERLNSTAEAAGLGYGTILEPAAILTAGLLILGIALWMAFDALRARARKLGGETSLSVKKSLVVAILTILTIAASVLYAIGRTHALLVTVTALAATVALAGLAYPLSTCDAGQNGGVARQSSSSRPVTGRWKHWKAAMLGSTVVLGIICYGAHEMGVDEGALAARGNSVDIGLLGWHVSSISATVVHVDALSSDSALKQLAAAKCLLQIGSGPDGTLLYNPAIGTTSTVPLGQIVVVDSKTTSCSI